MFEFLAKLFDTSDFPARWYCGQWSAGHGWLHILSDVAIFGAYTAIPCVLAFFILRRKDVPFPRILWLFVAFIFACGFGHLVESTIFWNPVYRFSGLIKLITAVVSWATVFALIQIVPQALHLPGLARLNNELRGEVEERKRVEQALRDSEEQLASLLESERAARGDAEHANRIKDEFLSTVSHELRTPLNAILGYAQLLLRGKIEAGELGEGLTIIERNAKVQAQIIEDLLDMSRIISGKVRLDVAAVELGNVIEAAVATVKPAADAKNIRIQTVLDSRSGAVFGDSGRLQQVVWNLLTNAIKFTPKGGRVQIVLARVNSHAEIRVADSGQGIAPELLPFIFDRFRQGDASTARQHGGLGLGLSIVKHLVELHGGTVAANSSGSGQGAMFVVSLPIQPVQSVSPNLKTAQLVTGNAGSPLLSLQGVRVLVVDDEADARDLVRRLLEECDARVTLASSVDEALQLFTKDRPDVILSDIGMPDRDGYDLIRSIRALSDQEGGSIPAAALTALARVEDRKRAMLSGFQSHITKPVDPGELIAVVATLTGRTGR
jgi:signal transduction histidine kinase/CheY-like chemotaxis protein